MARAVVDHQPELHRHHDVYWRVPDAPNTGLSRALHRTLAIGPLPVSELHEGAKVALRYSEDAVPEPDVLLVYLQSQPAYVLVKDLVQLRQHGGRFLTATDKSLLGAFTHRHGEVPTRALYAALHAAGLGRRGAGYLLATSPVIRRVERGRYVLRGQ